MKKISLIIFLFAIICGNLNAQLSESWYIYDVEYDTSDGKGSSEDNPILIETPGHLAYLMRQTNSSAYYSEGKFFKLMANISLSTSLNRLWIPIGGGSGTDSPYYYFRGTFDGNGFTVSTLQVNSGLQWNMPSGINYGGLFGRTDGAVIKNVTVNFIQTDRRISGGLIGYAENTTVENCTVTGSYLLSDCQDNAGGLIGYAGNTTITNCCVRTTNISDQNASNAPYSGGLAGATRDVTITGCTTDGDFAGNGPTGGLIGYIAGGENIITDCHSVGRTVGKNNVGGFIGEVNENALNTITGCRASGNVIGSENKIGGFIGVFRYRIGENTGEISEISNCIAEGLVSGIGKVFGYSTGGYIGGFIGEIDGGYSSSAIISDCRATGNVEGLTRYSSRIGGFIGSASATYMEITRCAAEGTVRGQDYVGGFVGTSGFPAYTNCYAWGDVTGVDCVGGFVGGAYYGFFNECFAAGAVEGNASVTGFAGQTNSGLLSFTDCYSVSRVSGVYQVAGFTGTAYGGNPVFTRCYYAGALFYERSSRAFGISSISITPVNCYFDKQAAGSAITESTMETPLEGIDPLATSGLTDALPEGFDEDVWLLTPGYYPQLRDLAGSNDPKTRLLSALSVVPLKLANDDEFIEDVRTIFPVAEKTPAGDAIVWLTDPAENATVVNYSLYTKKYDAWRTLTVRAGDAERKIMFRSDYDLMTTDISVKINNENMAISGTNFIYAIDCGSKEESAFAEIAIGGYASASPATSMMLYANQPQKITVKTEDNQTKTYTFTVEKRLSADVFVQRWNDVLAINNNFTTNGGYNFVEYEWYKDGAKMASDKGYIQEPKGLDKSAKYTARLTTQQGNKLNTCPAEISDEQTKTAVYPNPVQRGQTVRVETEIATNAVMQLFDVAGNIVAKQILNSAVSEIAMPDTQGQYILKITENGESQTYKIVVE